MPKIVGDHITEKWENINFRGLTKKTTTTINYRM